MTNSILSRKLYSVNRKSGVADVRFLYMGNKKNGFEKLKNLGVIGVSDWITNEAKKSFLKNAKIVKRIYNWIDLEIFNTKPQNNVNKNEKFTVFVASAGWENGS